MDHMTDNSKNKIFLETEIFRKESNKPITWKDIKHIEFQDDDKINIGFDEGFYSENNSWDPHYYVTITRNVLETDEQYQKRQEQIKLDEKWSRARQFKSYKSLKIKFEDSCKYCGSPTGSCTDVEAESCSENPNNLK